MSKLSFLNLRIGKRQKIILASLIMSLGLIYSTQTTGAIFLRVQLIIIFGIVAYLLSLWALWEGINKLKAIILLILPAMYAVAVASFYFLLPIRWLTRLPVVFLFAISYYTLLLSQNVFNVASIRTIPLYRAASTASFLFTLITAFFLFNVVYALNLPSYWNGVVVFILTLPLALQLLWTVEMEKISSPIIVYSIVIALLVGEGAVALSFWPVAPTTWSLALSTMIYVLLGLTIEFVRDRINQKIVWEFIGVGVVVLTFTILATSWGG